ncbi:MULTISPECIES: apolipoprotein N-acyltransferase [unclassified Leptolyngbya]|uniref:apolipoprotein N-acyltransferase n=1 Tax=unclassified Leptolyngbya TaxID=2650499 RepID=UPI0016826F09|nr:MULTISPECIES: apolipoprotein N-acyltransferase [unclassified Leptolyngbya]MBD1911531.1 apolipoprotein N-acyltransferase [Leptolyngbya sp. FACHB-8]MBD2155565.1 apolipoprotein N-acyltransferase [Leptolyngbya sp. FACHB-16]
MVDRPVPYSSATNSHPQEITQRIREIPSMAIAFLSGLLMALTLAPAGFWVLGWVALAPLWALLRRTPRRIWAVIPLCAAWGVGYNGLAISWIVDLHPLTWMGLTNSVSLGVTAFAWTAIVFWGVVRVTCWGLLVALLWGWHATGTESLGCILNRWLGAIALWCALEVLWSYTPLDWTTLAITQSPHDLWILHLGQLSGPTAVSACLVAINGLVAEAWLHPQAGVRKPLVNLGLGILLVSHLVGLALFLQPVPQAPESELKIGIIQGNIPTRVKLFEDGVQRSFDAYIDGYEALVDQGADAVLTPEGSFPWAWVDTPKRQQNAFYQTIVSRGIPAWVGSFGLEDGHYRQTLFTISGDGEVYSRYNKVKLVPLGEYIPFESLLGEVIQRLSTLADSMRPGSLHQVVDSPVGRAIAAICYDSAFPQIFRNQAATGGEFILTASNNDPYGSAMMNQHHAQDVMRAIETSRYTLRATNTGFSGVVTPHGRTLWKSGFRTYEAHLATIYKQQTRTLYVQWGNWLTPFLLGVALIGWLRVKR